MNTSAGSPRSPESSGCPTSASRQSRARRCFFALWPDEPLSRTLAAVGRAAHGGCGGRAMRRDSLHITLAFLGDIPADRVVDAMRVADGLAAGETFELSLDQLRYWQHNRILWLGGVSPQLTFLADTLAANLRAAGFALEARPFVAHMTLLRNAHCGEPPALPGPIRWPVREFVLAESHLGREGSRYEIIGRWPLVAAGDQSGLSPAGCA